MQVLKQVALNEIHSDRGQLLYKEKMAGPYSKVPLYVAFLVCFAAIPLVASLKCCS